MARGGSGNHTITYHDRHGNEFVKQNRGGEAIATAGPIEYLTGARLAGKVLINTGKKIGDKLLTKQATKAEARAGANSVDQRTATQPQQAAPREQWQDVNVANKQKSPPQSSWREGSGTSVHAKPKGPAPKSPASEFTKAEEKAINELQDAGMLRKEAEEAIRVSREKVQVLQPNGPNSGGVTHRPDWQKAGPGKHKP